MTRCDPVFFIHIYEIHTSLKSLQKDNLCKGSQKITYLPFMHKNPCLQNIRSQNTSNESA